LPDHLVPLDGLAHRAERLARIRAHTEGRLHQGSGPPASSEGSLLIPIGLVVVGLAAGLGVLVAGAPPLSALGPVVVAVVAALVLHPRLRSGETAAQRPDEAARVALAARAAAAAHDRALREWRAAWVRSGSGSPQPGEERR
jgi:hypothetical protein